MRLRSPSMHPDPGAIHQWAEEHGPAAISLPHSKNVEVVLHEPLVDSIKMQIGRYDLIIIEQENELGFCRVDCCIASNADAYIVLVEVNHFAVFGGLGILAREPVFRQPSSPTTILGSPNSFRSDWTSRWQAQGR